MFKPVNHSHPAESEGHQVRAEGLMLLVCRVAQMAAQRGGTQSSCHSDLTRLYDADLIESLHLMD